MKKILFTLLLSIVTLTGNAQQIYSTIKHLDKFDDVVKTENIKTRITIHKLDSTEWFGVSDLSIIEIETKGKEPVKYVSIYKTSFGDEENIKEITNGLYGYQTRYFCVNPGLLQNDFWAIEEVIDSLYSDPFYSKYKDKLFYGECKLFILKLKRHFLNVLLDREELEDGEFILTDRTVTTQYSGTFLDRLFWVRYNDDSRTIYLNN